MSFAAGETASLAEAALKATTAEPPQHVSLPAPRPPRTRAQETAVSDYALHWLSKTKLHCSHEASAAMEIGAAAPEGGLPDQHTDTQEQGFAPRTKSFGCQADAEDISAEVSGWGHQPAAARHDTSVPSILPPQFGQHRPHVEGRATVQLSKHRQFLKAHVVMEEPELRADLSRVVEHRAGAGGKRSAAAELVPLLEGVQSNSEADGGSPVSDRLLHASPTRGNSGSSAAGASEVSSVVAAEAAPVATSAEHWRRQDRYWTPEGWADSVEMPGPVTLADDY